MIIFITDEQRSEREHHHDTSRNKCVCERIKAILLDYVGWISAMVAQALRLHKTSGKPAYQRLRQYLQTQI